VRIDVGYDPTGEHDLQVITEAIIDGERRIVSVGQTRRYHAKRGALALERFQMHFSIGQPW
jgi:hypothetical protein